jgi:hypothetical protein
VLAYRERPVSRSFLREQPSRSTSTNGGFNAMSILWIILIVILVLALLGFFSRGRW